MSTSLTPTLFSIAEEVRSLSTSVRGESDSVCLSDILREELGDVLKSVFPISVYNSMGVCDVVRESAKRRVVVEEYRQTITEQQILTLLYQLQRVAHGISNDGFVPVEKFFQILYQSPQVVRECFSAAVINRLMMCSDIQEGCISSQIIVDFLRTCCRRSQQLLLVQSMTRSTEYITSTEFIDLVMTEISNKIKWENGMKDCPFYYAVFVERSTFFHLDPQRTGKVLIQDITSAKLLDDLFEVLSDQKRDHGEYMWDSMISWCSLNNFWRVLEQFRHCDRSWSGMVSLEECHSIRDGALTPLFLERVFATQTLYGDQSCREMDFRGFVELDIALRTKNQPASIKWLFRVLDLRDDGYLDRYEIKLVTESMLKNMSLLEGWRIDNADDVVDEIIDMLNPSIKDRISVDEMLNSRMTETALGILIDYTTFLKYENREEEAVS